MMIAIGTQGGCRVTQVCLDMSLGGIPGLNQQQKKEQPIENYMIIT